MLDRRGLIVGGVAMSAISAAWAETPAFAKLRAIESIRLPRFFNGVLAFGRNGRVEHIRCAGMADVEAGGL